ncbi:hypothetical protein V5799_008230 [Amblyomma americanum]|uniref:MD-2-related lipid-recognition domain-containing protein n=1 Tax=Amblyomma americanum TaxID=6943 RepID=A0AAQ4FDW1_AMBAM
MIRYAIIILLVGLACGLLLGLRRQEVRNEDGDKCDWKLPSPLSDDTTNVEKGNRHTLLSGVFISTYISVRDRCSHSLATMLRCVVLVLLIGLASAQRREVEISDCDQDTETAELSGKFKAWFLWLPIPSFGHDMCDDILKCPIVKGQTCNGTMPVLISNYAVPMKTSVEFKIAGDKGTSVCFRTKVVIK